MLKIKVSIQICFLFLFVCLAYGGEESDVVWREEKRCGVNSSYIFLRLHDKPTDYSSVLQNLPFSSGTSIKDLNDFIRGNGVNTRVIQSSPDKLDDMPLPAIVYLEPIAGIRESIGHFDVVVEIDEVNVTYIDGTTGAVWKILRPVFAKKWSGIAITEVPTQNFWGMYLVVFGSVFLAAQVWALAKRYRRTSAVAASLLLICWAPLEVHAQSKEDVIHNLEKRNQTLQSGNMLFERYATKDLDQPPYEDPKLVYRVIFSFDAYRRQLKQTNYQGRKPSTFEMHFDGQIYVGYNAGSFQRHSLVSASRKSINRFDPLYFHFAGIYVRDPLLPLEDQKKRKSTYMVSRLKDCQFEVENVDQNRLLLRQKNPSAYDKTKCHYLIDKGSLEVVKRSIYDNENKLMSTFDYSDFKEIEGTDCQLPGLIHFKVFDVAGDITKSFVLRMVSFTTKVDDDDFVEPQPFKGAIMVDFAKAAENDEEPEVRLAGENQTKMDETIEEIKSATTAVGSQDYQSFPGWIVWGLLFLGSVLFITNRLLTGKRQQP